MAMTLLEARQRGATLRYAVWLDTTKTVPGEPKPDGTISPPLPDPAYVWREELTTEAKADGETGPQFTARLTAFETYARLLVKAHALARLTALNETPLPGEGAAV